jgi:hypothetical protein
MEEITAGMKKCEIKKIDSSRLKELTKQASEKKNDLFQVRIKKAIEDATSHITDGCYDKMEESASRGFDKTIIYQFEWAPDKKATHDSKGNKIIFGENIHLFDLIKKETSSQFFASLNDFFNKDGSEEYTVTLSKKKRFFEGEVDTYRIFVSWGDNKYVPKKAFQPGFKREDNNL